MMTHPLVSRPSRNLKRVLVTIAVSLLFVAGLLLVSVLLPPLDAPVQVLNAPPAAASQALSSTGVSGTLASFAALFPDLAAVYLPTVVR